MEGPQFLKLLEGAEGIWVFDLETPPRPCDFLDICSQLRENRLGPLADVVNTKLISPERA